jgi:hypothetical protein
MKIFAIGWFASVLTLTAFAQTAGEKASPIHASVCEVGSSPDQFRGKLVTVHGRYNSNWEWGAWIRADGCDATLEFIPANGFSSPAYLSNVYVLKDAAFRTFEKQIRLLCNGGPLCDFDYVAADFTGVVVGPHEVRFWADHNDATLVVTAIADPKLHRDDHPMGTQPPQLPSAIPEVPQR